MLWKAYSFIVTYALLLFAEFWLVARLIGNQLEKVPAPVRYAILAALFLAPAVAAWEMIHLPPQDLPDNY